MLIVDGKVIEQRGADRNSNEYVKRINAFREKYKLQFPLTLKFTPDHSYKNSEGVTEFTNVVPIPTKSEFIHEDGTRESWAYCEFIKDKDLEKYEPRIIDIHKSISLGIEEFEKAFYLIEISPYYKESKNIVSKRKHYELVNENKEAEMEMVSVKENLKVENLVLGEGEDAMSDIDIRVLANNYLLPIEQGMSAERVRLILFNYLKHSDRNTRKKRMSLFLKDSTISDNTKTKAIINEAYKLGIIARRKTGQKLMWGITDRKDNQKIVTPICESRKTGEKVSLEDLVDFVVRNTRYQSDIVIAIKELSTGKTKNSIAIELDKEKD